LDPSFSEEPANVAAVETEAQRALKERPSFSVRTRIILGFLMLFLMSLGINITSVVMLTRIQNKLVFLESADNYSFEVQQARRFEKNFFLYRTNLEDARDHARRARKILERDREEMARVVGIASFETMRRHVDRYEQLLNRLAQVDENAGADPPPQYAEIEEELRRHGAEMVSVAGQLSRKERTSVAVMLRASKRILIFFLPLLLIVIVYVANFLTRQILAPLNRLMADTRRIADGDFTPITPRRRYRDELSELAMALNHMLHQLAHRHELLVQAHKLKAVGTLTAGVAHELNNPINNIMLTASMLEEDYKELSDEERLEMVRDLVEQADRSRLIVSNLLDFARESEMKTGLLQIKDLIEEVIQLTANEIKHSKVKVARRFASNLPPFHGDRQQISQVFVNLVLNAIDAMPDGGTLTVTTRITDARDYITVEIEDTGVGIPEYELPNIFDPFFTSKPHGKGTGLGLSVSLGIIRKHGGDIRVASRPNEGTVFTVLLPTAKVPAKMSDGSRQDAGTRDHP
jgi:signal transduction histidine kinase